MAVASDDLVAAARRLGPAIRACRDDIERERRLPASLLAAMHAARLFRMFIPASLGGLETDPITSMRVVEEIATADAAAAWNLMIGTTYGLWAALLPADVAHEIYDPPDAVVAGALRPTGQARAVDGGYVVDGSWAFASGIQHCAWWNAGCIVHDGDVPRRSTDGAPEHILVFFPARDGAVIDTWSVGGLRGTGSHDYTVADLFVPAARTIVWGAPPRVPGALYRMPRQALLDNAMAALPLGIARTAIDTVVGLAGGRRPAGAGMPLAQRTTIQADVARAEALLQSARAFLYDSAAASWDAVQAGQELPVKELAMLRLARTHAVQAAVQAVDLMYTDAGGVAIYTKSPLERCFRDVHTITQHVSMNPANYEVSGRILLGLDPDRPLYRL
ncbi:MAG: acyl-CoA dehydrogenase family protein [Proteobacteria bacterium]|nr:acyl-CoA dehydrogenase family protein [Pseudomonadota bacterium]